MRFTTKTEYGVVCLIYMARKGGLTVNPVTIREIATAEKFSPTYTEKILQTLRNAGIVSSQHGNQGGYILARDPSQITFKEIVEALEGGTFDVFCEPDNRKEITCTHFGLCGVKPIWQKTKDILDQFYGSITLDMMAKNKFQFDGAAA